jgi:hypothetical protein
LAIKSVVSRIALLNLSLGQTVSCGSNSLPTSLPSDKLDEDYHLSAATTEWWATGIGGAIKDLPQ